MGNRGGVNKIILVGAVNNEPAFQQALGDRWLAFSMTTSETFRSLKGTTYHEEFHQIRLSAQSLVLAEYQPHKGDVIYLQGRLKTSVDASEPGIRRYKTEVIALQ